MCEQMASKIASVLHTVLIFLRLFQGFDIYRWKVRKLPNCIYAVDICTEDIWKVLQFSNMEN